jgi:hypothetical protein
MKVKTDSESLLFGFNLEVYTASRKEPHDRISFRSNVAHPRRGVRDMKAKD